MGTGGAHRRGLRPAAVGPGARSAFALGLTLLLIGCAAPGPGAGGATVDVDGVVVGRLGQPLAGIGVTVDDASWAVTGADGRFAFDGVATPYDVTMFDAAEGWAHRTVGLTTADLELSPYPPFVQAALPGASTATVGGTLAAPVGAGQRARVCVEGHDRAILGCDTVHEGLSLYEIAVQWIGGTAEGTVRATLFDLDGDGNGSGVAAFGAALVTLEPGGVETADMALLGPVGEASLEVAVDAHPGFVLDRAWAITTRSDGWSSVPGPRAAITGDLVAAYVPSLLDATHMVYAVASAGDATSVGWVVGVEPGVPATLTLPPAPVPQTPLPGAVGVGATTPFTIDAPDGQVHLFAFEPEGDGPSLYVATAATTARIPDLSAISEAFALPPGAAYAWSVTSAPGGEARLAAGGGVHGAYGRLANAAVGGGGPAEDGAIAASEGGAFTLE